MLLRTKESANVGAAARAMLNFGLDELWLVAPRCKIDHRAYALASHAEEVLRTARIVDTLDEAIQGTALVAGTSARERAASNYVVLEPRVAAARLDGSSAVLFGPEDHGLANDDLTRCQLQISIPTKDFASLNLAQAVLVVAYECAMNGGRAVEGADLAVGGATRDQFEGFYSQLEAFLLHVGYTDPRRSPGVMRLLRGVFDRSQLSAHELAALRGLVTQALWAANQSPTVVPGNRTRPT